MHQHKMAPIEDGQGVRRVGNESHLSRLSSGLNQLRQQALFCDVNIIVGDQRFPAHKAVLSSTSDYFHGMFTSGFQESTMSEVNVPGTKECFAQILDFAYTGYFTLSLQTVTDILKMACYMVMNEAMELCADYLRYAIDHLSIEDCYDIWSSASNHGNLSNVSQLYKSHLVQNFQTLVKSREFIENSSSSVMMEFLSDEEIETETMTEEQILQAALIWLRYLWEQRQVHAVDLLRKIRLGLVPHDRLREILGDELLAIPECKDMVEEVQKLSVTKKTAVPPLARSHPELFATRNTITTVEIGPGVNHDEESTTMIALFYNTDTACYKLTRIADFPNRLSFMESMKIQYQGYSVCVTDTGHLYAAGYCKARYADPAESEMHRKWMAENNFFQYDSEKNEWILLPPMPILLLEPVLKPLGDYIYAVRSDNDRSQIQNAILKYCTVMKIWTVEVENLSISPTHAFILNGNLLIKGFVQAQGPNHFGRVRARSSISQLLLYKPDKKCWCFVKSDNHLLSRLSCDSYFIQGDGTCYMVRKGEGKIKDKINRVVCDLDSDKPTMNIAEAIRDDTLDTELDLAKFTFDRRKVGLKQIDCLCDFHDR